MRAASAEAYMILVRVRWLVLAVRVEVQAWLRGSYRLMGMQERLEG